MSPVVAAAPGRAGQSAAPGAGLRLALLGSRGIPANYGGYETLMEELGPRLAERGHQVTVYCRSHHTPRDLRHHRGCRLVVLPTVRTKHLDTPVHTLLAVLHAARAHRAGERCDAALMVNGANALFVPLLRLAGIPCALHVDGIERRRAKWGAFGRGVYSVSERLACWLPNELITDAEVIARHYRERYRCPSTVITYGVAPEPLPPGPTLKALGVAPRRYLLYVSRFEPENNPHQVLEGYLPLRTDMPLVMVGGAPYADRFVAALRKRSDARVIFPGPVYGDGYRELLSHAFATIHATEVGGTHPALVEALGYGNCALVNDTAENREVAADAACYFRAAQPDSLRALLAALLHDQESVGRWRGRAAARALLVYSWSRVCDAYEALLGRLAGRLPAG